MYLRCMLQYLFFVATSPDSACSSLNLIIVNHPNFKFWGFHLLNRDCGKKKKKRRDGDCDAHRFQRLVEQTLIEEQLSLSFGFHSKSSPERYLAKYSTQWSSFNYLYSLMISRAFEIINFFILRR